MKKLIATLLSFCTVFNSAAQNKYTDSLKTAAQKENNFYVQGNYNRTAAEWEPALGTMIVWPLCIPYKLVIELAKDNHLFTIVDNEAAKKDALEWFTKWGIDEAKTTFIFAPQGVDAWWVRDWGPAAVFTPDKKMKLADGKYIYSTPVTNIGCTDSLDFLYKTAGNKIIQTGTDDSLTIFAGKGLNMEVLDLPFVSTGGNVLTDGLGTAFSTCVLSNENRFYGVTDDEFLRLNKKLLGITDYHIISNFEKRGIQHIDCYLKLLDEERILVIEPPADHGLYVIYQNIIQNELSKLKTPFGRPYEILRIKSSRYMGQELAAYTNSIIINKTIYVPLFRIREDSMALKRWAEVMPGYVIKGFEFALADEPSVTVKMKEQYKAYGWNGGDALHCRTRAIWDTAMLFISIKRIDQQVDTKHKNMVYATIIDYSKKGIKKDKAELIWRVAGSMAWHHVKLKGTGNTDHFSAEIPWHKPGTVVEYYISVTSRSEKTETQPRTAPSGTYQFKIK